MIFQLHKYSTGCRLAQKDLPMVYLRVLLQNQLEPEEVVQTSFEYPDKVG